MDIEEIHGYNYTWIHRHGSRCLGAHYGCWRCVLRPGDKDIWTYVHVYRSTDMQICKQHFSAVRPGNSFLFVNLSISLSLYICLYVCLGRVLSIYLPVYLPVYLRVYLSLSQTHTALYLLCTYTHIFLLLWLHDNSFGVCDTTISSILYIEHIFGVCVQVTLLYRDYHIMWWVVSILFKCYHYYAFIDDLCVHVRECVCVCADCQGLRASTDIQIHYIQR
jgi:hypothetical protein